MEYLDSLNEQQRQAVETTEGPLLVLAGAGTGKTRVLTCRLAHILQQRNAWPSQMLAVTFTNKAANEMRRRIIDIIGPQSGEMTWLGTFHRIGTRILGRHAEALDLRRDFTILDQGDQISLLKRLLRERNIDSNLWKPSALADIIDGWKNRDLTPEEIPEVEAQAHGGKIVALYQEYQERLQNLNAVDFGDLLLKPLRLFRTHADILAEYQERFRYILVDEYQDTNIVQYLWLRLLAQKRRNLCCVGDDDQSIYSWRGAQISNILNFNKDFPEAPVIRLEQNYRSTGSILKAASGLIAANKNRLGKNLWTSDGEGEKLRVRGAPDSREEARHIAADIDNLHKQGKRLDDIAVLVRIGAQMRELEECCLDASIPYRVIGGLRFYERAEVRDINAYLRLIVQGENDVAFERIVNRPRRGLGEGTLETLRSDARKRRVSLLQAAREAVAENLAPRARRQLHGFVEMVEGWRQFLQNDSPVQLARRVMEESGYRQMLRDSLSADAPGRLENLDELLRSVEPFTTLAEYLEHVALVMDADQPSEAGKVSLMTMHSAKGLEFDTVFLPGWEEGLFPHQRSLDEDKERGGQGRLEEERRLAYVGITRAQRFACISFAVNRSMYGGWQNATPSRFLENLPEEAVAFGAIGGAGGGYGGERVGGHAARRGDGLVAGGQRATFSMPAPRAVPARTMRTIAAGVTGADTKEGSPRFRVGERVFHRKFGYGRVRERDGDRLRIDFEKTGEKMIIASFVEPASRAASALQEG